jgi:glutamine synthetase
MREATSTFVATCSLAGQVQGRSYAGGVTEGRALQDVGWVPANLAIGAFGHLADDNVFGSGGDLRLRPDPDAVFRIDLPGERPSVDLVLADQVNLDGSDWDSCPRTFLRDALDDLYEATGARVTAAFEHEFVLRSLGDTPPFGFSRHRTVEPFGSLLLQALADAGLEPENWLPEYGDRQFEITVRPAGGLAAADQAIALREIVREVADATGHDVTFAPILRTGGGGTGVHVHVSLWDDDGRPMLHDADQPGRLSALGRRLGAGIVAHAGAVTAMTAPSPSSFHRLQPHTWSSAGAFLAERNREAMLRICPTTATDEAGIARQLHLEFRAADATANPWLVLGTLIRAGLTGLADDSIPDPAVWPEEIAEPDLAAMPALPTSAAGAVEALEASDAASAWFSRDLLSTYLTVKRDDLAQLEGCDDDTVCARVADVY